MQNDDGQRHENCNNQDSSNGQVSINIAANDMSTSGSFVAVDGIEGACGGGTSGGSGGSAYNIPIITDTKIHSQDNRMSVNANTKEYGKFSINTVMENNMDNIGSIKELNTVQVTHLLVTEAIEQTLLNLNNNHSIDINSVENRIDNAAISTTDIICNDANNSQRITNLKVMRSVGSLACRICQTNDQVDRLISPCLCKGTLAYVHKNCLEHWLSTSGILHCELCQFRFQTEQTLRYRCFQSLRLWFRHPNNRRVLKSDVWICSLLTIVTFGLIAISLLGLQYFVLQGSRIGISRFWTHAFIIVFLAIIILAYFVNAFLILRGQIIPWYRWWQSARQIKLTLIDRGEKKFSRKKENSLINNTEHEIETTNLSTSDEIRNTSSVLLNQVIIVH